MGYYIEGPTKGKVKAICDTLSGIEITPDEAEFFIKEDMAAVVCVVDNGPFEAAAYCYNLNEFKTFSDPSDTRPKTWILVEDVKRVRELTRFSGAA